MWMWLAPASARTLQVPLDYDTLASAVDGAQDGDVILLGSGATIGGPLITAQRDVTIRGTPLFGEVASFQMTVVAGANVVVEDLAVDCSLGERPFAVTSGSGLTLRRLRG